MFFDVHCHLTYPPISNSLSKVINNAKKNNLKFIFTSGTEPESNRKILKLAKKYNIVKPTLGIYPVYPKTLDINKELKFIEDNIDHCPAIGEVGLDRPKNREQVNNQKKLFLKFINLSKKHNKPLIVHSRGAEKHVLNILEEENAEKVVMHCYNGPEKHLKKALNLNYFFSVPPRIIKDKNFQEVLKLIPKDKILTETDSPYMAPLKEQTNEPSNVTKTVKFLTNFFNTDMEKQIEKNFYKIFSPA